jgi:ribosomal protein L7Ae-like RNA K-turn-binding protein
MNESALIQAGYLAYKSRSILTGDALKKALKYRGVYYVIIASDTSINHKTLLVERLDYYKIPYYIGLTQEQLKDISQKKNVAAIGITNAQLGSYIKTLGGY